MPFSRLDCGPCSANRPLASMYEDVVQFERTTRDGSPNKVVNPDIESRRLCWKEVRTAIAGKKEAQKQAREFNWVEIPEHLKYQSEHGTSTEEKRAAKDAIAWFIMRADFPEVVSFAIDKTIGRVVRKESEIEGLAEEGATAAQNLTMQDLERADEKGRSWRDFEELVLREKFTTKFTAYYIYNMKDPAASEGENSFIPKVRTIIAENICDYDYSAGQLTYIMWRERVSKTNNRFDRHKSGNSEYIFREIELVSVQGVAGRRVIEKVWRKGEDGKYRVAPEDQKFIEAREKNITSIPVVIDGGLKPEKPAYQALVEKCKEFFRKSAMLEYRYYRIAISWLWINKKDEGGGLLRRAADIFRKAVGSKKFVAGTGTGGSKASARLETPGDRGKSDFVLVPGLGVLGTQNSDVKWLIDEGSGIDKLVTALERCERHMASLGAHFGIDFNFSNIAESTFKLQQSGEAAHIIAPVMSSSTSLTQIARWIAFFKIGTAANVASTEAKLSAIKVALNTKLVDEQEGFTLSEVADLYERGLLLADEARAMLSKLAPNCLETLEAQEFLRRLDAERSGQNNFVDPPPPEPEPS